VWRSAGVFTFMGGDDMKRAVAGVALACGTALLGCEPLIVDLTPDQQPVQIPSASSATGGGDGDGDGDGTTAFAWKGEDGAFPGLDPIDPDALVLSLANVDQSCGFLMPDPLTDGPCTPEMEWQLLLAIPPAVNRPGLIDLGDPRVQFASATRFADCVGGATGTGHGTAGTLELLASDETSVTFELHGAEPGPTSGVFVAARCGAPPPAFAPSPAVAVPGSTLSGNPSSGTGPTADPGALYLFFGEVPATCAEPQSTGDCTANRQMVLALPPGLQIPGEVSLTDPTIDAMYTAPENSCSTAAPDAGTLTISSVTDTTMAVRIYGSSSAAFDGEYAVTICP
jgi:hypothetical protein